MTGVDSTGHSCRVDRVGDFWVATLVEGGQIRHDPYDCAHHELTDVIRFVCEGLGISESDWCLCQSGSAGWYVARKIPQEALDSI